jgi:hypothetical protein
MLFARTLQRLRRTIAGRPIDGARASSNYALPNRWVNYLIYLCLIAEYRFLRWFRLPFGITVLSVCTKER